MIYHTSVEADQRKFLFQTNLFYFHYRHASMIHALHIVIIYPAFGCSPSRFKNIFAQRVFVYHFIVFIPFEINYLTWLPFADFYCHYPMSACAYITTYVFFFFNYRLWIKKNTFVFSPQVICLSIKGFCLTIDLFYCSAFL